MKVVMFWIMKDYCAVCLKLYCNVIFYHRCTQQRQICGVPERHVPYIVFVGPLVDNPRLLA